MYQTATKVNVLSPVILDVKEVDSLHLLEDHMNYSVIVRNSLLFRGLSQWYGTEWKLQELGRSEWLHSENRHYYGHECDNNRPGTSSKCSRYMCAKEQEEHRVKVCDKLKKQGAGESGSEVGLTHSTGVTGVMSGEAERSHSKGLALFCNGKEKHKPTNELEELCSQN